MMSKALEALEKINHTLCLNSHKIEFGVDEDSIDCKNVEEFVECYNTIRKYLTSHKDIEEAFGIDLGILVEVLKQGFIYVPFVYNLDGTLDSVVPFNVIGINRDRIIYECPNGLYATELIKDYGKTWVLKEGDLL